LATIVPLSLKDLTAQALGRRVAHLHDDPSVPLCVKLEGALLRTGTIAELALALVRRNPLMLFVLLGWAFLGVAEFKERVAQRAAFDPSSLAYRRALLAFLRREARAGRDIYLVAAAQSDIARAIANHLGLFTEMIEVGPDEAKDGEALAKRLCGRFGTGDFDFAGSGFFDLPVWRTSRRSVIIAPTRRLLADHTWNSQTADILCLDDRKVGRAIDALRPGRWFKNLLIFVPLFGAAGWSDPHFLVRAYLAFCAYCLIASAGYVANDLADLMADRRHVTKRKRVLAAGRLSIPGAVWLFLGLVSAGFGLDLFLSPVLAGWMAVYLALSFSYSLWIKKTLLLDTFVLAALSMHRVLTGCILAAVTPSLWQILFTGFFFLGLAMLTRFGELKGARFSRTRRATRAGAYRRGDLDLLAGFGLASGYLSALILALYPVTPEAHGLFHAPYALWNLWPLEIYWISRVWIYARRGRIPEDPLLFALKDRVSLGIGLASIGIILVALFANLPLYALI
jgi:4-hydroxybenzoate polyprenyltransferase